MKLETGWYHLLEDVIASPEIQKLKEFLEEEKRQGQTVFPQENLIFNTFRQTPFDEVKVVIMGQDPYHGTGQAHGLSFSVPEGIAPPPSLKNIFKELHEDLGIPIPTTGCLMPWAKQGVLLLNAVLTVRKNSPTSHYQKGWEYFTDEVIKKLIERDDPIIFVLWGKAAKEKFESCFKSQSASKHLVLMAPHPSPYSAYNGFFGCRHFSKINAALEKWKKTPIQWQL
jgi:uracil-DNA glycosylase